MRTLLVAALMVVGPLGATELTAFSMDYSELRCELPYTGQGNVTVIAHDQRPYVMNRDKEPNFMGLVRGGFGNPFSFQTKDKRTLADTFVETLVSAFNDAGFHATRLSTNAQESHDAVMKRAVKERADVIVLLNVREWKTDTKTNPTTYYDLDLQVFDSHGKLMANADTNGAARAKGKMMKPLKSARPSVMTLYADKMLELFSDHGIESALTTR